MAMFSQKECRHTYLDSAPAMIVVQDLDHNIVWANLAYQAAVGKSLAELQELKCYQARGLARPCQGCSVEETLRTGTPSRAELRPDNQPHWIGQGLGLLSRAAPVHDHSGKPIGAVELVTDISDYVGRAQRQEQVAAALLRLFDFSAGHSSQELLREILDEAEKLTGSKIGFYHFVDDDQETLSLQMWSTNTEKFCHAPGAGTHYPVEKAGVWVDCVRTGQPVVHNDYASLPHKKGLPEGHAPLVRELVLPVIRGGKIVAILGVGNKETDYDDQDVASVRQLADLAWEAVSRKQVQEWNKQLQLKVDQAQKMESIGRLAGGVAHDFNNMLSVILGQVELAIEELAEDDPVRDNLEEARTAARRSADLTHQLLAFARRQTIDPQLLDLNETVGEMLKMIRRLIGENIQLNWKPAADLGQVQMDPGQVDQILANLCVNSRDAIGSSGTITIETANTTIAESADPRSPLAVPGQYVLLTVTDDGCGLDAATLANIFEPFFTTKQVGQGTGLGLSTVYGIIKQNDGFVEVDSEPGQGTTFRIYLPRHFAAVAPAKQEALPDQPPGRGETVLLVEDETMILNFEEKLLEKLGYRVLTAATPEAAIELARNHGLEIDLVLTDVMMPGINGPEMVSHIREFLPGLPALFLSGYTANAIFDDSELKEGVEFLQKPFSREDLAKKLRNILSGCKSF
jgi:two-component system cell cycle sensor histidine kinase/response regulator CckA